MSTTQRQLKVNMPEDVKRWLAAEADRNMRSQTAEIVLALKEKMARSGQFKKGDASA